MTSFSKKIFVFVQLLEMSDYSAYTQYTQNKVLLEKKLSCEPLNLFTIAYGVFSL